MHLFKCFTSAFILFLCLPAVFLSRAQAQGTWARLADLPAKPRSNAAGFTIAGKGYIATGDSGSGPSYGEFNDLWEYDTAGHTWTQKAPVPGGARAGAIGFSINGMGYAGLAGRQGDDLWMYNPAVNRWYARRSFPGGPRFEACVFVIGHKAYVGCGTAYGRRYNDFWVYDAELDAWSQAASLPSNGREAPAAFAIGNKGYVGTGADSALGFNDLWEYDPAHDKWTQKASMPTIARFVAVGFSIRDKGYIGMGALWRKEARISNDLWQYDTAKNAWTEMASCDSEFAGWAPAAFVIGQTAYCGTGWKLNGTYGNQLWSFSPAADTSGDQKRVSLFPNPFRGTSGLHYTISSQATVKVMLYDISGRLIATIEDGQQMPGKHEADIDATALNISNGIYIVKIEINSEVRIFKLIKI